MCAWEKFVVYADYVNYLSGSVHTIKRNTEALIVASKETRLEVNADKTKYMVMSRHHNVGWSRYVKIGNSSFEKSVEQFKYLETTVTNENCTEE
jgi:hypothetical protein